MLKVIDTNVHRASSDLRSISKEIQRMMCCQSTHVENRVVNVTGWLGCNDNILIKPSPSESPIYTHIQNSIPSLYMRNR